MGSTFLVCHGAWSAGWAWKKMHPLMAAAGHRLVTPTQTGIGEREHLANPSIDLEMHIQDVLNVIRYEDLRDIVLIGHSYGGMVIADGFFSQQHVCICSFSQYIEVAFAQFPAFTGGSPRKRDQETPFARAF